MDSDVRDDVRQVADQEESAVGRGTDEVQDLPERMYPEAEVRLTRSMNSTLVPSGIPNSSGRSPVSWMIA